MVTRPLPVSRMSPTVVRAQELVGAGRVVEARALLEQYLRRGSRDAPACGLLGFVLASLGDVERAVLFAKRARSSEPANPGILQLYGNVQGMIGNKAEAIEAYQRSLAIDPDNLGAIEGLAMLLSMEQRYGEVRRLAEHALALEPGDGPFTTLLASSVQALGHGREALAIIELALERAPDDEDLLYGRAATMNCVEGLDPATIAAAHRRYGDRKAELAGAPLPAPGPRRPGPLRVGLVSGDLRAHSCANFLDPLLRHADRDRVELIAFSTNAKRDPVSERLKPLFSAWHELLDPDDRAAAETIRSMDIDILLDLSGLTAGERLGMFALRPARAHATYLGYPNTTGLRAMDRRIVDAITDPPGFDDRCTERLARLDGCFVCFGPVHEDMAEASPRDPSRPITFASFNVLTKVGDGVVDLWTRVLNSMPASRLLLKAAILTDAEARADVRSRFERAGLAPDRLELMGWVATDPLLVYDRVDVALDPFPYNGTTTTCEALWMGVPVVTLAGNTHAGRVGASLLTHAGLPDLIASTPDQYVDIARTLAATPGRLDELRRSLRARVRSTISDGAAFARRFERALLEMMPT